MKMEATEEVETTPSPLVEIKAKSNDEKASSSSALSENGESDAGSTEPIMRIPNEVWVLILSQLNQKELIQARTVWKKFREVVDAHFEFTVIVHDGKTDLDRVYELRIRDCLITRLLRDKDIFQYPALLRRIRFWGPIHVNCFQRIMSKTTSVEELSLTKFALMQDDLVGHHRLVGFSKIKKLELLGYMCKDASRIVTRNASKIFSYTMPELEKLTINFHCDIISINNVASSFLEFLSRHNRLLNLQASLVPEASPVDTLSIRTNPITVPESVEEALKQVKLNLLRITTASKDLPIWIPLLNSQTHLQDLRVHLNDGGILPVHTNYTVGIPIEMLLSPLRQNARTLTFVELKEIRLTPVPGAAVEVAPFNANVFRYTSNLKRLILYRNSDDFRKYSQYVDQPNIINLKMLPTTIEVLEISRFYCLSEELQFLVDVLTNLKNIVIMHTGTLNGLGVHGGIVASIAEKPLIQTMNLSPLNYYNSIENKKYEQVKEKYEMNTLDHVYYDFERWRAGLPQPQRPTSVFVPEPIPVEAVGARRRPIRGRERDLSPLLPRVWAGHAEQPFVRRAQRQRRQTQLFESDSPRSRRRRIIISLQNMQHDFFRHPPPNNEGPGPRDPPEDGNEGSNSNEKLIQSLDLQISKYQHQNLTYSHYACYIRSTTSPLMRSRSWSCSD